MTRVRKYTILLFALLLIIALALLFINHNSKPITTKSITIDKAMNEYVTYITEQELNEIVTGFQAFGYMSSVPYNYGEVEKIINTKPRYRLSNNDDYYSNILYDGDHYCFIISKSSNKKLIPCGIIFFNSVYDANDVLCINQGTKLKTVSSRFKQCIVSPSLIDGYSISGISINILTNSGLTKCSFNSSEELIGVETVKCKAAEIIASFLQ